MEDNESGVLVPAGDVAALAKALEALIDDETRRHTLGRAAQARTRAHASGSPPRSSCHATKRSIEA